MSLIGTVSDHVGPDVEPCCAKSDRHEQNICILDKKGACDNISPSEVSRSPPSPPSSHFLFIYYTFYLFIMKQQSRDWLLNELIQFILFLGALLLGVFQGGSGQVLLPEDQP